MTGARTLTRDNLPSVPRSHTFTSENLPPLLSPSPTHVHQWVEGELRDGEQLVARHVALATAIKGTEAAVQCCDLLLRNCRHTSRQAGRQAGRQASQQARKLELWEMRSIAAATDSWVKGSRLALTRENPQPSKEPKHDACGNAHFPSTCCCTSSMSYCVSSDCPLPILPSQLRRLGNCRLRSPRNKR